jgi:hypothetical protein
MSPCASCAVSEHCKTFRHDNEEWRPIDGLSILPMALPTSGTVIRQHSHSYDHVSMLAKGSVRVWQNGVLDRDYTAPFPIAIAAGVMHRFESLEDDTLVLCIHNTFRTGQVEVLEPHGLPGE